MEPQVTEKIGRLRSLVEADPRSGEAWGRLAMNFDVHGLKQEAVTCYRRAAELEPEEFRWPYYCAIALRAIGSPEALEWFERSRALQPRYAPLLLHQGQALFNAGRLEEASQALHLAIAADPRLSQAHLGLARIALSQGDLAASRDELTRALAVNPSHRAARGLLAEVYRRLNEPGKAERESWRARQLPDQASLRDSLYAALLSEGVSSRWYLTHGQIYMERGRADAAARQFRMALRAKPDAHAHNNLGMALQYLGKFEEAAEQHQAALALRPAFREALINLGSALFEMGEADEAIAYAERARELDPEFAQAYLNLGIFYTRLGRYTDAIEALRLGLLNAPYDIRIANRLAWLLATSPGPAPRNGGVAVSLAVTVCDITGYRVPESLDVLAAAYAETGQFERAAETARRARELATSEGRGDLADRIRSRLALYEAGQPYREQRL